MNTAELRAIVGAGNVSDSTDDLVVYGRDASRLEGDCLAVVWPSQPPQVTALVEWAQAVGVDLTPRGAGTGLCGGATPQKSLVVDLSRLNTVVSIDTTGRMARVGAGVVLGSLNRNLKVHDLFLPVVPGSHRAATIGGMIATNAAGLRAVRYGSMRRWVQELSLVDGRGRLRRIAGDALDDVVGREGVTGFIVEATVRLAALPHRRTVSLFADDDESVLSAQRDEWISDPRLTALEYLNRHAAGAIGWEPRPHLLAEFDSDGGELTDPDRIDAVWRARDGLYPVLAGHGYPVIEDPKLDADGLSVLLPWLDAEAIPAFGHLGVGIIHPCFPPDDERIATLYGQVADLGGQVSGEHGVGLKKKTWTTASYRAEVRRLKDIYDPQGVLNRGKLC
ncbi:putative FAD-linked oxidoreductase [bacterium BMS3Bbin01]|nr:putative FAD-linked oxidoreductase [bacterium BMS3Bbin01]